MADSHIQEAFDQVCTEAKQAQGFYVVLMQDSQRYGGPEEGGWWINNSDIVAYQHFATEEQAQAAANAVETLAKQLEDEERRQHGEYCLRTMEFLEDRGLDADFLPDPDGPNSYRVLVSETLPLPVRGSTHYE